MSQLLCELINATLTGKETDVYGVKEEDWEQCFDLALQQQVLAMTFPTMAALPKEHRPNFTLWSKWMAYAESTAKMSRHKREIVRMIGTWLAEEGVSTMIIKGFSLAALYPRPELRESSDIDIYSGNDYDAVNACLTKHGLTVGRPDGHHANVKVDGVSVEHHFSFDNSRVKDDKQGVEKRLRQLAIEERRSTALPGICFPNAVFTALYVGRHAYKHFLSEKIELRHVIDWALCLKQLTKDEAVVLHKVKGESKWGRFLDVLTAIALHRLGLPKEWFPKREWERAETVAAADEQRLWDDIICAKHKKHGRTTSQQRLIIGRRLLQNRWKFDAYADESASVSLCKAFVGWLFKR